MNHRDGIQVDKNGRIGYNIAYQADQMFTLPSPYDILEG